MLFSEARPETPGQTIFGSLMPSHIDFVIVRGQFQGSKKVRLADKVDDRLIVRVCARATVQRDGLHYFGVFRFADNLMRRLDFLAKRL
jgi:hypothetical protein